MRTINIMLNSVDKVKKFVNIVGAFDFDCDLVSDRYVVDAKSIMGIFSLDLGKSLKLNIHTENEADAAIDKLKEFIV